MVTRAALYARFSTDRQDATSIEDQVRVCRARADALGFEVVATYADPATSGAVRVVDRPGGAAMHAAALAGEFGALILESLDRLSRDSVDAEAVVRRLEHRGVRIIGLADGYDTNAGESRRLLRGMRGLVNEVYRADLPAKTRRGLDGQVARGFSAGGLSYGYRSVAVGMDDRGHADGFRLEVVPEQADVVRWIFAEYAAGRSVQRIAAALNARGVRGPGRRRDRPSTWSASALYGTPAAGSGVLSNELYRGRYVWNRREWIRDPDNPKRRTPRMRPASEWRVVERPDLRIVDDATWDAVRARLSRKLGDSGKLRRGPGPRTLFGGLLRCGECGGAVIAVSAHEYGCAARKDRGVAVCAGVRAPRKVTDARLVATLRDVVLTPAAIEETARRAAAIVAQARQRATDTRRQLDARRATLRAEIDRLADAVAEVGLSPALRAKLEAKEGELRTLEASAAGSAPAAIAVDAIRARVREFALRLEDALRGDVEAARAMLAGRLGTVTIERRDGATWARIDSGAGMLLAGAVDSIQGCGGRICAMESARRPDGPTGAILVRLAA